MAKAPATSPDLMHAGQPGPITFEAWKDLSQMAYVVACIKQGSDGHAHHVYTNEICDAVLEPGEHPKPLLLLDYEAAGNLMTALWHAGVRPAEVLEANETLQALREVISAKDDHIADLRKIALHPLGD